MKKSKSTTVRVLSSLLAMLGFAACGDDSSDDWDDIPVEYGTPTYSFQVKGQVTDPQGSPINGIRVIVRSPYGSYYNIDEERPVSADTIYTDGSGNYTSHNLFGDTLRGKLYFEDPDSTANGGAFRTDSLDLNNLEPQQIAEGEGWHQGSFELTANKQLSIDKQHDE